MINTDYSYYTKFQKEQWRDVAKSINEHITQDEIVIAPTYTLFPLEYYLKNETMKQHIIRNPVLQSGTANGSWEKINKSSSLILKMSVQKGFMDWLFNKK